MNKTRQYKYYKFKYLEQSYKMRIEILLFIKSASELEDIDAEILFGIISLEKLNRGDLITQVLERMGSTLVPSYLIKRDMSLGIGQVKISTAKKVLTDRNGKEILKSLLNTQKNIKIVAKLLSSYLKEIDSETDSLKYLVNKYTTGKDNPKPSKEIELHLLLLKWSVQNEIFKKTIESYKEII